MQAAISDRESVLQMQLGNTQVNGWQKTRVQMDDSVEPLQQHWTSDFLWRTGDLEFYLSRFASGDCHSIQGTMSSYPI